MTSDAPNTAPDVAPPALVETLRLAASGALLVRSLRSDLGGAFGPAQLGSVSVRSLQIADSGAVPDLLVGGTSTFAKHAGFNQDVEVLGTLSKAGGSFRIDHPLDPENRYLLHSFVESPDMMNVYNGNVTLDGNGEAWVELPVWFEALNRDFRYQLTPLGAWSAVWIGREISGNRFQVRGGPGAKVSWQVTGIRHDRWAEAHRIPVEQPKPASEQGTYLHPEVWGQPVDRGLALSRAEGPRGESPNPEAPAAGEPR